MSNTDFCSDALLDYLYTQTLPTPLPPDYTKDDFSKWQIKKRKMSSMKLDLRSSATRSLSLYFLFF